MPLRELSRTDVELVAFYSNSNIHPKEEYELRLATLKAYLKDKEIPLQTGEYDPELWKETVGIFGGPYPLIQDDETYEEMLAARKQRCAACYRLRFDTLAAAAKKLGATHIASTLTISPYQFIDLINDALVHSAQSYGVQAMLTDWHSLYQDATRTSRELGMYRQNYCGCHYSKEEAAIEREARKRARKSQKAAS